MKFSKKIILLIIGGLLFITSLILLILNLTKWHDSNTYAAFGLIIFIAIMFLLIALFDKEDLNSKKKIVNTKMIAIVAIMSAFSAILYMFVKFPLPFFPSFLDIQVSEIPALIAGYALGPIAGSLVLVVRFLIKLPFSSTAMVGELADLIMSLALIIPASLIYKRHKNLKGALISFAVGGFFATGIAVLANWAILIPFYLKFFFNGNVNALVGLCSMIPNINAENYMGLYLLYGALPFNLLRYSIVGILTFLLYKRIHFLIKKI